MKALWIRIEAHEIDSVNVARLAEAIGVDVVTALGHFVALGGAVAEHAPDGHIATVPDAALERWGRWFGRRGKFAPAVREIFQDEAGTFGGWAETMGKLVERREKERTRKAGGNSAETPRQLSGNSGATERNGTERNGTERNSARTLTSPNSKKRSGDLPSAPAREAASASAPPAVAGLPEPVQRLAVQFLATFYADATAKRISDVGQQLEASLNGGAKLDKNTVVRAGSIDRLMRKLREVLDEGVHNSDRAIRVLLLKLADTSDGSAPGAIAAADDEQRRERTEGEIHRELIDANGWLEEHPDRDAAIEAELTATFGPPDPDENPIIAKSRTIARNSLVLRDYRAHQEDHAHA